METTKIFLASSAELVDDRKEFEILVSRKSNIWKKQGIELELFVWEDFLDAMSSSRLQAEYNNAIRKCDIFVMLFFSKVGKHTAEEFDTAFGQFQATSRPVIFTYFKDGQISTGSLNLADIASLLEFKAKLASLGHFHTTYKHTGDLLSHFQHQLDKLFNQSFFSRIPQRIGPSDPEGQATGAGVIQVDFNAQNRQIIDTVNTEGGNFVARDLVRIIHQMLPGGKNSQEAESVVASYLKALAIDLAGLRLGEIDSSADQTRQTPLELADIYVPLSTTLQVPERDSLKSWLSSSSQSRSATRRQQRPPEQTERPPGNRVVTALEALAAHREFTLLGQAGGGKSTFGAMVLLSLAQACQGHTQELKRLGKWWEYGPLLPIRVVLRRFAEELSSEPKAARAGGLWEFIGRDLQATSFGMSANTMEHLQRIARERGALFLFDGLDECGDPTRRNLVVRAVRELIAASGPKCRFIVTARPYAWNEPVDPRRGVYLLAGLTSADIELFIANWYKALMQRHWRTPADAEQKRRDLIAAYRREDLLPLAQNPLLLTLMATLHSNRGGLPDDRADLYDESVLLLLQRWNRQIGADRALLDALSVPGLKLTDIREVLEELAFSLHHENVGVTGTSDIGEGRLINAFRRLLSSMDKAALVVEYVEKRAGLLIGLGERNGERQFTFPHRTFQEFLAACHLAARADFATKCAELARQSASHWQVVLPLAARIAKTERGATAADELIGSTRAEEFCLYAHPSLEDWLCGWLAGLQIKEIGLGAIKKSDRTVAIARRVASWLAAMMPMHPREGGPPMGIRFEAGRLLAQLGDIRFSSVAPHLPTTVNHGFRLVKADPEFRIGTRHHLADQTSKILGRTILPGEINDQRTPTGDFFIAKFPVTVGQFRAFLQCTGKEALEYAEALALPDNCPVRYVNWNDAQAYCDWLTTQFLPGGLVPLDDTVSDLILNQGWRLGLPTELQWEKAARGESRDRVFPWGDDFDANCAITAASEITQCAPVGCTPANQLDLSDMVGNLQEWTSVPYRAQIIESVQLSAHTAILGDAAVRSGTWEYGPYYSRCSYRGGLLSSVRHKSVGFRVVCVKRESTVLPEQSNGDA